jgi:uncharacterized protein (TIGR02145 family)/uncharacterized repeat protein (TIGR02543 family)
MRKSIRTQKRVAALVAVAALTLLSVNCNDSGVNSGGESKYLNMFLDVFSKNPGQNGDTATTPTTPATYTLTVTVSPAEGGTVSRNPNADSYNAGTHVTVTATPNNDYEFLGWTGALNSNDNSVTVTMDGNNKTLSAGFRKIGANLPKYTVYFNANGAVGAPPEPIQRDSGSVVSLPDLAGLTRDWHSFAGWNTKADGSGKNYEAFESYAVTGTATLFAKWTRDAYTLTVNAAVGGTTSRYPNQAKYDAGTQVTVTAEPNEHFTFTNWSGASNSTNPTVTITMDSNKELTPVFTQNTYTLTTNISVDGGGSVSRSPNANSYAPGTEVTVTATAATAQGYTFSGWSGASTSANPTVKITMDENKTLTAGFGKRDATKFTVTFNRNGATVGNVEAVTADSGATVTLPGQGSLEKSGYSFAGWNTNSYGTGTKYNAGDIYRVIDGSTLYARWIPVYTVSFSDNGATGGSAPQAITADSGSSVTMPVQGNITKIGHTFGGWNTKSDGTGTNYGVGQTYTVTSNVTLYAKWTAINCAVTFNGNGATSGIPTAMNAVYSGSITLPSMARTGYTFGGWYENSAGTGTGYAGGTSYTVTKDITLYANWTPVTYTITYTLNDGAVTPANPVSYTVETASFTLTNPTRSCYTFTGWTGSNGTTAQTTVSIPQGSTGNKNYTANWAINTYTLTTTANPSGGGTISRSPNLTSYDCGTSVLLTATASAGYTFTGWSSDASGTANPVTVTMNGNKSVTANFVATYTLTTIANPSGGGTFSRNPDNGSYNAGTSVSVTATATSGYTFTGWSGASTSTSSSITITMDGNKTLTANFAQVFTDTRNNKTYKKVTIGGQTWMAENLNYQPASGNSWCYENSTDNCNKYGRLYDWATAMNIDTSYNHKTWGGSNVKRQGVCPSGWHLPSRAEWDALSDFAVDGKKLVNWTSGVDTFYYWPGAGTKLKSKTGWYSNYGTDDYGFSALPGGNRNYNDGSFNNAGDNGNWWTATEYSSGYAYNRYMNYNYDNVDENSNLKSNGFSVRCVGD